MTLRTFNKQYCKEVFRLIPEARFISVTDKLSKNGWFVRWVDNENVHYLGEVLNPLGKEQVVERGE